MARTWFTAKAESRAGEIHIYDEIGAWGITAADFIREVKALGPLATLDLRINSPGGSVFDGLAIHNALKRSKARVTVTVDGIAASIASVIAMAGDEVVMPDNALMMVHDPSGGVVGNSRDMRELAETLDKIKESLIAAYAGKTGLDRDALAEMMEAETWLTAAEALDMGFADRIDEPVAIAASFDLSKFRNAPASAVLPRGPAALHTSEQEEPLMSENETTAHEPEVAAGETESAAIVETTEAEAVEAEAAPVAQADSAEEIVAKATAAANARAAEIIALCAKAGVPAKAGELIASGKGVGEIAVEIINTRSPAAEPVEISARHAPAMRAPADWSKALARVNAGHKA